MARRSQVITLQGEARTLPSSLSAMRIQGIPFIYTYSTGVISSRRLVQVYERNMRDMERHFVTSPVSLAIRIRRSDYVLVKCICHCEVQS